MKTEHACEQEHVCKEEQEREKEQERDQRTNGKCVNREQKAHSMETEEDYGRHGGIGKGERGKTRR